MQFSFFSQRSTVQNNAKTGVYFRGINPQTGVTAQSSVNNLDNGDYTTYYRAFPTTVVSVPYNTLNEFPLVNTNNDQTRDLTGQTYIIGFMIHNGAYQGGGTTNWWIDSIFGTLTPFQNPVWVYENSAYTPAGSPPFPYNGVFAYLQALQAANAKVLVSLGGSTFTVADIATTTIATQLAQSICFSLLGQTSSPNPLGWTALTTDAGAGGGQPFAFDGIDLDFENPSATDVTTVTTLLSTLRTNAPFKLITCAPQTPYLWEAGASFNANGAYYPYTAVNSPITSLKTSTAGSPALLDVNNIGNFSQINMQFYNQSGTLVYPGETNFVNSLAELAYLCLSATTTNKPLINIGLLGSTDGSYPIPIPAPATLAQNIVTGVVAAQALVIAAIPGTSINQWLNGLMFWESPVANTYAAQVVAAMQSINPAIPANVILYGGQNWSAAQGVSNPGWTSSVTPPPPPGPPPGPPPPGPGTYTIPLSTTPVPTNIPNDQTTAFTINLVFTGNLYYASGAAILSAATAAQGLVAFLNATITPVQSKPLNVYNFQNPALTTTYNSGTNSTTIVYTMYFNNVTATSSQIIAAALQLNGQPSFANAVAPFVPSASTITYTVA
jgi:hypothetical protein